MPILLNTSLNVNKNPIASTEQDAIGVFDNSDIDVLCLGNRLYFKISGNDN
jgi:predicted NodU family carbamoyl transferase